MSSLSLANAATSMATNNATRNAFIDLLKISLVGTNKLLSEDHVIDMEKGVFNYTLERASVHNIPKSWSDKRFTNTYVNRARSVFLNITDTSYLNNKYLIEKVVSGEIKPHEIAFMKPEQKNPEIWSEIVAAKKKIDDNIQTHKQGAKTDMFKCHKCGQKECTYTSAQIRSADEPETIFVTCLVCSNNWRMG